METKITLDNFLKEQEKPSYLCIISSEKNQPNKINLIRWLDNIKRCDFLQRVVVDIDLVDHINPTEDFYYYGDKKHTVVEVIFKENATVPVQELMSEAWRRKQITNFKSIQKILDSI